MIEIVQGNRGRTITRMILLVVMCSATPVLTAQTIVVKPYLQNASPNAMTVMWEADNVGAGTVHYGLSPFQLSTVVESTTQPGSGPSQIHTAVIEGLDPDIKHYYRVEMAGGQMSLVYAFVTPDDPANEKSTQLVAISDMQRDGSHPNKFKEIIEEGIVPMIYSEIGTSLNDLEGIMIPGDLVVTGGNYSQWGNFFFGPADSLLPHVPVYPVLGNHEYFSNGKDNFLKYFTLPENGPVTLLEECWYKDISNVRIIGLNSNSNGADQSLQLTWLGALLDSTCAAEHIDFVFAQLHHPFKSELWTPGELGFTGQVIDSLETFTSNCNKPSIHFFGHTHGYSRGQSRDHKHLWVNVATAGGAIDNWGEFPNADYEEFVKSQDEYGFVVLDVQAGNEPQFSLKRYGRGDQDVIVDNELRDALTIYKNVWVPAQPENVFPLEGDTVAGPCITLKGSQFNGVQDSIQAAHWQVARGGDFVDSLVVDAWYQNENFYNEVNLQANDDLTDAEIPSLAPDQIYFWRVRYRDQSLDWSPWSDSTTFFAGVGGDTLSSNLVLNGGAESGISSWTGDIESLTGGECNSVSPYLGASNFAVGGVCANESATGVASQTIDLSDYSAEIGAGAAAISFGAFMRSFSGTDVPEMYVEFYDGNGLVETTISISSNTASWTYVEHYITIPSSAIECKVVLEGTRNGGSDNDSYFDEIGLIVLEDVPCPECFGESNIDKDEDGFCSDVDCDDSDPDRYPGANEVCDGKDNNCDDLIEIGDVTAWTGAAGNGQWSDADNWDQGIVPLRCQYVTIDSAVTVTLDSAFECRGLTVGSQSTLVIGSPAFLSIDSQYDDVEASVVVLGTILIHGRCDIRAAAGIAFDISGVLINTNKLNATDIEEESIAVRSGGRYESLGTTILK